MTLILGCSKEGTAPKPGSLDPGAQTGWGPFGPPGYPMHQDQPSWSAAGEIAYRDNGVTSIDSLTGAFQVDPDLAGIWILDPQNGQRRKVLPDGYSPVWSPDGQQIAFVRAGQIYVADRDGSNVRQVTSNGENSSPSWHPDGTRILYDSYSSGSYDIWAIGVDGTNPARICSPVQGDRRLGAWNPDGIGILAAWYSGEFGDFADLYSVDSNCRSEHLTEGEFSMVGQPRYSPDGGQVAVTLRLKDKVTPQVWVMSPDGMGARPVTPLGGWNPAWSPDGKSVVFARPALELSHAHGVLWTVNLKDGSTRQITNWWPQATVRQLAGTPKFERLDGPFDMVRRWQR